MDDGASIAELRGMVRAFVAARGWPAKHTPANLAMSISIEVAELLEHFQWSNGAGAAYLDDPACRLAVTDELADVLIYCLSLADLVGADLGAAIESKLDRTAERYPPLATYRADTHAGH